MLSITGEYALQAMVFLAQRGDDRLYSAALIADEAGIPQKYLSTILGELARAGLVEGTRGKGGGFRLSRPAERILLTEVVGPFEPANLGRSRCPFGNVTCSDADPCAAHDRWKSVKTALAQFFQESTLQDVAFKQTAARPTKGKSRRKG